VRKHFSQLFKQTPPAEERERRDVVADSPAEVIDPPQVQEEQKGKVTGRPPETESLRRSTRVRKEVKRLNL